MEASTPTSTRILNAVMFHVQETGFWLSWQCSLQREFAASNWTTYGTSTETWIFKISQIPDFEHGTESALQTLLHEYYPYPDVAADKSMGSRDIGPIDVSDTSGSQEETGPNAEPASGSKGRHGIGPQVRYQNPWAKTCKRWYQKGSQWCCVMIKASFSSSSMSVLSSPWMMCSGCP